MQTPEVVPTPEAFFDAIRKIDAVYDFMLSLKADSENNSLKEASEVYLKVRQVAELTRYTEQTIRTKVMTDEIPSIKVNGKRLFRKSDILKWLSNGGR